ncbi:MAG: CNNM domain-containing protein, partial [Chitinophagaceae bacterium]
MIEWKTITWFILTLLLMGFFAGIEMAYYSANRLNIELRKKQGGITGTLLAKFIDAPASFIGTTLIGFTIFLVFFSLQISNVMKPVWAYFSVGSDLVHIIVEIAIATFVVLLFAEFIPRAIFRAKSNTLLSGLALVTDFFYQMFSPIADAFIRFAEWLLKYVLDVKLDKHKEPLSHGELKNLFQNSDDEDRVGRSTQLLENAQEFPKVKIRQCLVPRKEVVGIDIQASVEDIQKKFIETKLSKLIVYENNIDHISGYVHQLDLFRKPSTIQ